MKKFLILMGVSVLMLCASCKKEKSCRCTVVGTQRVRIVNITSGTCSQIGHASYADDLDTIHTDYLLCTDYPFGADSLIVTK